jgi:hypothetical protein
LSGTTTNNFTTPVSYVVTAADGSQATYVVTVTVALSSAKAIAPYSISGVSGIINESLTPKTIAVTLPAGTNPNGLIATFTTTGQSVTVGGISQLSGATTNNFTTPVSYLVTAADGTTATYIVTVTVAVVNYGPAGAPPSLGTAATYGMIASNAMTISAAPTTHIYGDVALINNDSFVGFALTGVPPAVSSIYVTGHINSKTLGNPAATAQAELDLNAAYANLSGRVPTTIFPSVPATELSGMLLTPGIYSVTTPASQTLGLSDIDGPLVLDAGGNPNAVFIFQANAITTTTGSVLLQGGAQPNNVFWLVTTDATIGNGASTFFQGTIVAGNTITVGLNTSVEGRMLAGALGAGAITNSGVITVPQ